MKKYSVILMAAMGLVLCGCGNTAGGEPPEIQNGSTVEGGFAEIQEGNIVEAGPREVQDGNIPEAGISEVQALDAEGGNVAGIDATGIDVAGVDVTQGGSYGEISIILPVGWSYEVCPMGSDNLIYGKYGIHFYPEGVSEGCIALSYMESFGVCGTGLKQEQAMIAGNTVSIGTYDDHGYWDFISFGGEYEGVVALTYSVDSWWGEYGDQVTDILDTLVFDQGIREGNTYIFSSDSEVNEIGLHFSLENISATGATIVLSQFDVDAPKGELICGEDFVIEQKKEGKWESAPIVVEGDYGFNDIALIISAGDKREDKINWEWLYGTLVPGEYRIGKSILDVIGSGNYDTYMIYAQFVLN